MRGMTESRDGGFAIMSLVLHHSGEREIITEQYLNIASRHGNSKLITLLIGHQEIETPITEDVVQQAISNYKEGPEIFQLFWDCLGKRLPISKALDLFPYDTFDQGLLRNALELLGVGVPGMHHLWDRPTEYRAQVLLLLLQKHTSIVLRETC
ncbi:hypothetical protein BJX65DRAFT_272067 [Aspergillus insuetus]